MGRIDNFENELKKAMTKRHNPVKCPPQIKQPLLV